MDLIQRTGEWFAAANQQPTEPTPNAEQVAFYLGMQCEELAEKLAAIVPREASMLHQLGVDFKGGVHQSLVSQVMQDPAVVKEMLDGDMDLLWVSIGAARALGSNVMGAYQAVSEANWKKEWPDGKFHNHTGTGKVIKPDGWQAPDLTEFIHPSLR